MAGNIGNTVTRSVTITDQTSPVVVLQGSGTVYLPQSSLYTDDGASWTDNVDGSGTIDPASSGTVDTSTLGTYTLEYTHTDMAGNIGNTVTRSVTITDATPPVVVLVGSANMTIAYGSIYSESGATWTDTIDGSGVILTPVTGVVNPNAVGTYYLTYNHTDTSSNISNNVIRTVRVTDQAAPVVALDGGSSIALLQ